jgi:hypothetical protein
MITSKRSTVCEHTVRAGWNDLGGPQLFRPARNFELNVRVSKRPSEWKSASLAVNPSRNLLASPCSFPPCREGLDRVPPSVGEPWILTAGNTSRM